MKMKFLGAFVVSATMAVGGAASAATVVVDSFDTYQKVQDLPDGSNPTNSMLADGSVLGGNRFLTADNVVPGNSTGATSMKSENGSLDFDNGAGAKGTGTVAYGQVGGSGTALGDLYALSGSSTSADPYFFFSLGTFDNNADARFFAIVEAGNGTFTYSEDISGPGFNPQLYFSQFGGADFTDVISITFGISTADTATRTDYDAALDGSITQIDLVGAVPLPAGGLLLVGGLAGLGLLRRRKSA